MCPNRADMRYLLFTSLTVLSLTASAQAPEYVPEEGLIAWYALDGNATDLSGSENNGSLHGPSPAENRFGQSESCLEFNREELDYISTDIDDIEGDGGRSMAFWARVDEGRQGGFALSYGPELFQSSCNAGFHIDLGPGDCGFVGLGAGANCYQRREPFDNLYDNSWHHFVITYSGGGLASSGYWIDGELQPQTGCLDGSFPSSLNTSALLGMSIGRRNDGNLGTYFDGLIDEVGVWSRELTPSEIGSLFNAEAPVTGCTSLEACNFNPEASLDDGSCSDLDACGECGGEGVAGCTAPEACNYSPIASCDDGGCVYPPVIDLGEDVVTCEEEITLQAGQGHGSYAWNTGETSESIVVSESGVYEVTVDEYNQNARSLSFDGADDYMDFPDIAPELYTDAFTIMVHAYLEDVTETDFYNILSTDDNSPGNLFQWGCKPDDLRPELYASNGAGGFAVYSSNTPVTSNQWHHIAISYDGNQASSGAGELRFYTDGVETGVHSADIDVSASLTIVGHYLLDFPDLLGALEPWSGGLDDMQIWNTPLSESEIFDFMNCPPSPGTDGLVAYWSFDAGQGDSVVDLSGNGFHGTLINGTAWSEELPPMVCAQQCSSSDSVLVSLFDYPCLCGDGTLWDESSGECVPVLSSQNACGEGTEWDVESQTCIISNPSDTNFDGCVSMTDLLDLLSVFGTCNEVPWSCGDPLEYQGYDYETVQIGEQCWFAENLRAEAYSNGDPIPMVFENSDWQASAEGARCWINNDSTYFGFPGFLYHGYTVIDNRGVCPAMWHVADDAEWMELEIAHGLSALEAEGTGIRGGDIQLSQKMRVASWGGTNELGFGARRGGYRSWETGSFSGGIDSGAFWSNGESLGGPGYREFHGPWDGVARGGIGISEGLSIRCIKDSE